MMIKVESLKQPYHKLRDKSLMLCEGWEEGVEKGELKGHEIQIGDLSDVTRSAKKKYP